MNVRLTVFARTFVLMFGAIFSAAGLLHAQQPPQPQQAPADPGLLIQTETRQVLVDAIVTDKKGNYITDLKAKDFRVQEDGKEQPINSFSFEADPANGSGRTHYLVLLFDNTSMNTGDQAVARQAAAKFIDTNAGPDRMMEVVNYGGAVKVEQKFTADAERLKAVVNGIQFAAISTTAVGASPAAADFAVTAMLESLRTVAKGLGSIPGRKILVLFTAGFTLSSERVSEATATINECNKANVAIYPVDVRGLSTGGFGKASLQAPRSLRPQAAPQASRDSVFKTVAFVPAPPFAAQAKGGGGASGGAAGGTGASGGGSRPSSGSTPSTGGNSTSTTGRGGSAAPAGAGANLPGAGACPTATTTPNGAPIAQMPNSNTSAACATRNLIPKVPDTATPNQQIMFLLADGTGGFVIHDSNDLLGGLQKIGKEQNQYYLLGYTPPDARQGSCHVLHVKVDRGGTEVRARTGYCSAKPMDVLSGNPVEKTLEAKIAAGQAGPLAQAGPQSASMRLPFFFDSPNVARVNVAMEFPATGLKFEKKKDAQHAEVNFLGVAYTPEGTVAARFSDVLRLDYASKEEADLAKKQPLHYENQFDIASGKYTFKLVFSEGGDNFGKLEMPLEVDSFKSDQFAVSGLALSKEYHRTAEMGAALDAALIEDKKPLIADAVQVVPTGSSTFAKSDLAILYVELYEPLLASADNKNPPAVGLQMRVLDRKTGEEKANTGLVRLEPPPPLGNSVIPLAERMPVSKLGPGSYRLEVTAADSAGQSAKRTADFDIQ